ncbi:MAG: tRNA preQ1(34) S-adenosylmethionine ribosyltransferase-isomerase QueA [Elusimicrobia bacterium]|nr:tRNA preQ1(34) S-adenosylmethionine ribosyltransferase-isomerase QueA [Elusimicrobiota bacterium]
MSAFEGRGARPAEFLGFPEIPADRIAQTPLAERDRARLMVLSRADGGLSHRTFSDLPDFFSTGDALVLNNVRVLPARLVGQKPTGGRVTVLLLARFPGEGPDRWTALVTPRPRPGAEILFPEGLSARVAGDRADGEWELVFSAALSPALERLGLMPLPPYIKRPSDGRWEDGDGYQTVFAVPGAAEGDGPLPQGAVAAPTAGLHFTPELLDALRGRGVRVAFVTLWVGWGTFRPISTEDYRRHRMLPEPYRVPAETAETLRTVRAEGKRIWAVGTTVVRTLESATGSDGAVRAGSGTAALYITPGYRFRSVDRLLTNFHMPHHTPLLLAAAFAGVDPLRRAYVEALAHGYRFFSYGDAMAVL